MKSITLAQVLKLQIPSRRSKIRDHISLLNRRIGLWKESDIKEFVDEGRDIPISRRIHPSIQVDGYFFRQLMSEGKVRSALNYLSCDRSGCVLGLEDAMPDTDGKTYCDVLIKKSILLVGLPA